MRMLLVCLLLCSWQTGRVYAQTAPITALQPARLWDGLSSKITRLQSQMRAKSDQLLTRLRKKEQQLYHQLQKKDSATARRLFADMDERYARYRQMLRDSTIVSPLNQQYQPTLDSLRVAMQYLSLSGHPGTGPLPDQLRSLQQTFNQDAALQHLLADRSRALQTALGNLGFMRRFAGFQQQLTDYRAIMNRYRDMMNAPDKLVQAVIRMASTMPVFKKIFQRYSALAALLPPDPGSFSALLPTGTMQVRNAVMTAMSQSTGVTTIGTNFNQQISAITAPLQQLKDQVQRLKAGKQLSDLPEQQKPSNRSKTFMQRLEVGGNFQSVRSSNWYPTTSDLGLSLGYRINAKSVAGIGASLKVGWGRNLRNMDITGQGAGLRSFLTYHIKGSFHATGGFELNYQQPFERLPEISGWQQSGLIGISKIVSLQQKLLKKMQAQLLCDLLAHQQVPRRPTLLFRFGYTLK